MRKGVAKKGRVVVWERVFGQKNRSRRGEKGKAEERGG